MQREREESRKTSSCKTRLSIDDNLIIELEGWDALMLGYERLSRDSPLPTGKKGLSVTSERFAALYVVCSIAIYIKSY